jgi:polyribonucleotide nucleotidyltransferase
MVESEARELSEEIMLGAVNFGHDAMMPVIGAIIDLAERCAREPRDVAPPAPEIAELREKLLAGGINAQLTEAYGEADKMLRQDKIAAIKAEIVADLSDEEKAIAGGLFKSLESDVVRGNILKGQPRIDGRSSKDVRAIDCQVGILPLTHGSALFTRGETQALATATLGTGQDEQIVDRLEGSYREHFMLHYNFPPYSVGEASFMKSPGRREIGHGKLAWRAVHPLLPTKEEFPYTIRVVSEITESNGSSSMASVCGASLSLMDAGVPLKRPVAGIAMGLIKEGNDFAVISDILGDEDHLGDMDFKVAGTDSGITALQMDIKITSITREIMEIALGQAREGRLHILGEMSNALTAAREGVSDHAPRITTFMIPKDKIREVIGTGGKVIREICEATGAKIDIEDDGTIKVAAVDQEQGDAAIAWIKSITAEPEVGAIYDGKIVKIMDFGAFVNFMGPRDGLVHISELAKERVATVGDVVKEGDLVKVKCIGLERGKVKLSMKRVDQETGADLDAMAD